ncbi:hypothetical protein CO051_02325 [Candidatus Roizmanbacteria bacterium CG_4_9_14_0_2_um_filter_39_13]|uniref:Uncharacterized protein n=1 Tax=Candidatus Roizmanbacteria bacterium CG_4_9_14_0_2_um_filter_39_13 TaxID=1974839 RepID=A0A2M8F0T1_9BACT|nr:MAG: hypothetical protein CO051_02325 [Candidatus Roizmanbacteria bacterium CG_4_9_14_0_2_um_filter_39_13]
MASTDAKKLIFDELSKLLNSASSISTSQDNNIDRGLIESTLLPIKSSRNEGSTSNSGTERDMDLVKMEGDVDHLKVELININKKFTKNEIDWKKKTDELADKVREINQDRLKTVPIASLFAGLVIFISTESILLQTVASSLVFVSISFIMLAGIMLFVALMVSIIGPPQNNNSRQNIQMLWFAIIILFFLGTALTVWDFFENNKEQQVDKNNYNIEATSSGQLQFKGGEKIHAE